MPNFIRSQRCLDFKICDRWPYLSAWRRRRRLQQQIPYSLHVLGSWDSDLESSDGSHDARLFHPRLLARPNLECLRWSSTPRRFSESSNHPCFDHIQSRLELESYASLPYTNGVRHDRGLGFK